MFWNKKNVEGLPDLPLTKPNPALIVSPNEHLNEPISGFSSTENEGYEEHDEETEEKHKLPSFPDSAIGKGFSQSAIKEAVGTNEDDTKIAEPLNEKKFKTVEMDEWSPNKNAREMISTPLIPEPPTSYQEALPKPLPVVQDNLSSQKIPHHHEYHRQLNQFTTRTSETKGQDIFVKIDKFYAAKKAMDSIAAKLEDIDSLLHKIRETKMREDQELSAWEKDLTTIKSRISEVTSTIFEKA